MAGGKLNDIGLTFEAEMKRDLYASLGSVTQEKKDRLSNSIFSAKSMISLPQPIYEEFEFEEEEDVNMTEVRDREERDWRIFLSSLKRKIVKKGL